MNYYLLFIFILNYRNYVKQKANSSDFLFELKMGCKVAETTRNIINTFGPGAASKCSVVVIAEVVIHGALHNSRSFLKETRPLKMRSIAASQQKLTTTN